MTDKALVLIDDLYEQYHLENYQDEGLKFSKMLKSEKAPYFLRVLRKFHLSSFLPFKKIWFAEWVKYIQQFQIIILGDAGNTFNVVRYIKKRNPNKRVIVWYRNSVYSSVNPNGIDREKCELWTFDKKDSLLYEMNYNPQFYIPSSIYIERETEYDAFFIGKDKGRLDALLNLEHELKKRGLKTKFCIVNYNSEYMTYNLVLENISKSKVLIDIQASWQEGITLRPLEALFYKKKLITNNKNIYEYNFYNKNNVFILGKDSIDNIENFIKSPYIDIDQKIIDGYTEKGWANRYKKN